LHKKDTKAFTRVELLIVLATVGLLGSLALSVLGSSATRSDLAVCANNLRQVGRAFHMWASDHGGENPWWTPHSSGGAYIKANDPPPPNNTLIVPGMGPSPASLRGYAWFQFSFISEELRTPAVLVCPSDSIKVRSEKFGRNPNEFFHVGVWDRALSYLVGLHALNQFPSTMLSGDRSINEDGRGTGCSVNVGIMSWINLYDQNGWSTNLHPISGNILFNDGRVEEMTAARLNVFLGTQNDDGGTTHLLKPLE